MAKEILPFNFDGWDDVDTLAYNHYRAEFTEDFGEFQRGEKYECVNVDYANGVMEAYGEDGAVLKKQIFKLAPVE